MKRHPIWHEIPAPLWDDWHWQQRNRIRSLDELERVVSLTDTERRAFIEASEAFRVAITPYYASLMQPDDPSCPIRKQAVPGVGELEILPFELEDPLGEEAHMPVPGITHRYPDRALLYVTHNCPVYCRHCTRKRKVSDPGSATRRAELDAAFDYIETTDAVRDVIVSGGDPLSLSDDRIEEILQRLRAIPHVEVIRIGTRNPVTLPQRITPKLCAILAEYGPIYLHTHFNHPAELTPDAARALDALRRAGAVLGNQMVLLRGINDSPQTVMTLNRLLLRHGCRPYYMLQCDMAEGITHFRTPLSRGLDILRHLRGRIGGMGIPDFVVDLPGGGGKIELTPDYEIERREVAGGVEYLFQNGAGERFVFHDVAE